MRGHSRAGPRAASAVCSSSFFFRCARLVASQPRRRLVRPLGERGIDRDGREHLGRHELERLAGAQALAGHALRHLAHEVPLLAHGGRAVQRDPLVGQGVVRVFRLEAPGALPDLLLEPARGQGPRAGDPRGLVLLGRHAGEQAHLAPRQLVREQRALEGGQPGQGAVHPRQLLELPRGEPRPLARVVAEPRVAEALRGLRRDQPLGDGREHATQRAHGSREPRELLLGVLGQGVARRVGAPGRLRSRLRRASQAPLRQPSERRSLRRGIDLRGPARGVPGGGSRDFVCAEAFHCVQSCVQGESNLSCTVSVARLELGRRLASRPGRGGAGYATASNVRE